MESLTRGVMTFGFGAARYRDLAATLGRSLALHAPDVPRALVTDEIDGPHASWYDVVIPYQAEHGTNVRPKLHLDAYAPFDRTLFIDSDVIAVRGLDEAFELFEGFTFAPVGDQMVQRGASDSSMNVDRVLDHFGLDAVPRFNGGVYYLDRRTAGPVMDTARQLLEDYHRVGFADFRGDGPYEEAIFAVAMALHELPMLDAGGRIMATPSGLKGRLYVDVLAGESRFNKYDRVISPALVHFSATWASHPVYRRERRKLEKWAAGWSRPAIERFSRLLYPVDFAVGTVERQARRVRLGFRRRFDDVLQ